MKDTPETPSEEVPEKKSFFGVILHSFFVVPFLIAVFSVLLFAAVRMLTMEKRTVYDYLNDVKVGGATKRWQAAFELSKILRQSEKAPKDERFVSELISAFEHSVHDDNRVRQYLALAMGRIKDPRYVDPLLEGLQREKPENLPAMIHAIGLLQDSKAATALHPYLEDKDPRVRLTAVIALGNIGDPVSIPYLKNALRDSEINVTWDAAIALAKLKNTSGSSVLATLLDREYLDNYPNVDRQEQNHILITVIQAAAPLNDALLNKSIQKLAETDTNINVRKMALETLKR